MHTNRLAAESSPYLLQHAHNPVDWFPWGDEAMQKARDEDKPILISIGYSACHWCHVMERESFEDPETAALMNRLFVNIKIDREERPDLDHIYMDAVQAIAGNGGWPLNVFLTPEGKPFYGGTYFPPVNLHNRPSWKSVLQNISTAFQEKRTEINEQADHLTKHIAGADFGVAQAGIQSFSKEDISVIYEQLMKTADKLDGGFGQAPKFPQTFSIRFLLQYYYYSGKTEALNQACLSLDKMIYGGIYDQLGGGFARYSTDSKWLAPHFEKMLYDNALLIITMSEAFQATGKPIYSKAIHETMDFVQRELMSAEGGFYSALDADSEGEEGKFYIWRKNEISEVLREETDAFCAYYDVSERGNWEGKNILQIKDPEKPVPEQKEREWKTKLMAKRNERIRPALDDKILSGWNALMITACCKAYSAVGEEKYRSLAIANMDFLEKKMRGEGIFHFHHSYKKQHGSTSSAESSIRGRKRVAIGEHGIPAFLDDYAYLIEAYIQLQEITGEASYLIRAKELTELVIENFSEKDTGYFYYTHTGQDDLIVRKREVYDGPTASGNSVMAANLLYLGKVFDLEEWKQRSARNAGGMKEVILRYPGSFGVWATLLNGLTYQLYEIVLAGSQAEKKHLDFLKKGIPNRVFQISSVTHPDLPLLINKPASGPSQFFLCRDYACQQPVTEVAELVSLIKNS
jgi:uncharacterized protein YyaL (SSP411 family)